MINTNELLKKYNFRAQKKYGQNFLTDPNILEGIVSNAQITKDDIVLEIGPGLGALTELLCKAAKHVISVEIDKMLIPLLTDCMKEYDNFTLVNADILKIDIDSLINEIDPDIKKSKGIKVVANLPYYITTPIVMDLLEKQRNIDTITVMVQKEVAQRMKEGVGTKAYGALSLAVQYYSKAEIVMAVSKNCFFPKPDVDSAVIRLDIYDKDARPVDAKNPDEMFKIIRAAFNQRRKTLVNALSNAADLPFSKEQIIKAIKSLGKPETVRGEALSLFEFAALSDELCSK